MQRDIIEFQWIYLRLFEFLKNSVKYSSPPSAPMGQI
jgi:hypothetical protein